MNNKKTFLITETLLGLGCFGLCEMIIASLNWQTLMTNETFQMFRPGNIGAQISVFLLLFGFLGLIGWFVGLFNETRKSLKTRNILTAVFILEFIAVVYLYQGI